MKQLDTASSATVISDDFSSIFVYWLPGQAAIRGRLTCGVVAEWRHRFQVHAAEALHTRPVGLLQQDPTGVRAAEAAQQAGAFAEKLSAWLKLEVGKSRKQRRTVKQLHADLVALGFEESYGRLAAFPQLEGAPTARAADERRRHVRPLVIPQGI